jgi:hypothetical protein
MGTSISTALGGYRATDRIQAAMEEMERYCAEHPYSPPRCATLGCQFVGAPSLRCSAEAWKKALLASATTLPPRCERLTFNIGALLDRPAERESFGNQPEASGSPKKWLENVE